MIERFDARKFSNDFHWHTRTAEESSRSYDARLAQVAYDLGLRRGRNEGLEKGATIGEGGYAGLKIKMGTSMIGSIRQQIAIDIRALKQEQK